MGSLKMQCKKEEIRTHASKKEKGRGKGGGRGGRGGKGWKLGVGPGVLTRNKG